MPKYFPESSEVSISAIFNNALKGSSSASALRESVEKQDKNIVQDASSTSLKGTLSRKTVTFFLLFILFFCSFISLLAYINFSSKRAADELKSAQAVSDIAMALTRAQLSHIKPSNQNWLDEGFIKASLQETIPAMDSYALSIDAQGKFSCCPYVMRIYTDRNLDRFLIIAQPQSGILSEIFPKSIIILDSSLMELRVFKDIRRLNRLLAKADPLENAGSSEIKLLMKEGKLITPAYIAEKSKQADFAPPKSVAWTDPGIENFVFNSPRYYRLAEQLIEQAVKVSKEKAGSAEVAKLKKNVQEFSKLKGLILYSKDASLAEDAKKSIELYAPTDSFLFGYLELKDGVPIKSYMLEKNSEKELALASDVNAVVQEEKVAVEDESSSEKEIELEVDANHPIYIRLKALTMSRENELRPLSSAIYTKLARELECPSNSFHTEFQNLFHTYLVTNNRHKQIIKEEVFSLFKQYDKMPIGQFLAFLNRVKLGYLVKQAGNNINIVEENCLQNLQSLFRYIQKCQSIVELDNLIQIALSWITFDYIKDAEDLVKYQNMLRNNTLDQLNSFILSNSKLIPLKPDDKEILFNILDNERLVKEDEKEFFIAEFENLAH